MHGPQSVPAGLGQRGAKVFGGQCHQFLCPQRVHRPDQGHLVPAFVSAHGQQSQNFGLNLRHAGHRAPAKPLPCDALVGLFADQAGRHGMLLVMCDVKAHPQFGSGLAGATFAHHGEGCGHWGIDHLNVGLKLHGLGQPVLQDRYVHHPVEFAHTELACAKVQLAAMVAPHLHLVHWRNCSALWPAAQVLQQSHGRAVERVSPNVSGDR